jgi:aspartate/methionine/tyrosine aminotransferase
MFLRHFPPMGIYETLFRFADATQAYLGDAGTHPWAQGYPLTRQLPGGPSIPASVSFGPDDLRYPNASGQIELREALVRYYRTFYGANLTEENIAVFPGGRPGIMAILALLEEDIEITIEETEYTPYHDSLRLIGRAPEVVPSNPENRFRPTLEDHARALDSADRALLVKSNPCNPTGVTWSGDSLRALVELASRPGKGALIDEAYEFFHTPEPDSALRYIEDIDRTDIFVVGAATKGLQVPGARIGWVVASKEHCELFRNLSSIAMGGVSRLSQLLVTSLLEIDRVGEARRAIGAFFASQRERYGNALTELGFELFTGEGGFYHWGRIPGGMTAHELNDRLFRHDAAILPGRLCDMDRREQGPHETLMRFSFGPIPAEDFEGDVEILRTCLTGVGAR